VAALAGGCAGTLLYLGAVRGVAPIIVKLHGGACIGLITTGVVDHRVMGARMRGTIEPLALTAAIVAAAMVVFYVWLIRQQGNQPLLWVLIVLLVCAVLAAYGALWRVPYRRAALVPAVIALTVLGVLGILSIGLPILASGILALVSLLRPRRHQAL
jgi:hypothetical protein